LTDSVTFPLDAAFDSTNEMIPSTAYSVRLDFFAARNPPGPLTASACGREAELAVATAVEVLSTFDVFAFSPACLARSASRATYRQSVKPACAGSFPFRAAEGPPRLHLAIAHLLLPRCLNSRPVYADAFCEYTDVDLTEPPAHAPTPEG